MLSVSEFWESLSEDDKKTKKTPNQKKVKKMPMQLCSVNIPKVMLQAVEKLVTAGYFESKADCFREILHEFIKDHPNTDEILRKVEQFIAKQEESR